MIFAWLCSFALTSPCTLLPKNLFASIKRYIFKIPKYTEEHLIYTVLNNYGILGFFIGRESFFFLLTWPKFLKDSNTFHSSAYTWISSMPLVNPDWYSIYHNACSPLMYHYVNELMLLHNILHYSPYVIFTRLGHGLNFFFLLCPVSPIPDSISDLLEST